ncbi:MAG: AI-2E family transporter [Halobacteriovoraceae bacterium]|nr:AI-2E family transporter [Halobacteriovoraceae bacterium]
MSIQSSRTTNICLVILAFVAVTTALVYTRVVLVPFVISLFAYTVASPTVSRIRKKGVPHFIAMGITIFGFLFIMSILLFFVVTSIEQFVKGAHIYRDKIIQFIQWFTVNTNNLGFDFDQDFIQNELRQIPVFSMVKNITGGLLSLMGNFILVMVFTLFMLAGEGLTEQIPSERLIAKIKEKVSHYVIMKTLTSVGSGVVVFCILAFCGIDLAFMFGLLTVLLNFIPSIGGIISTLLPLPVILLEFGLSWQLYCVLILSAVVQFAVGNIIEPKILGESMDLHPVALLVCLVFWGLVWGIPGMFMAVPITGMIKIVFARIEITRPIAELMAGRISGY